MSVPHEIQEFINRKVETHPYLRLLYEEAKNAKNILELGIHKGRSTKTILYGCRDGKRGHLYSIDWGGGEEDNNETPQTVNSIKQSELNKYFTWMKIDIRDLADEWFIIHPMDLIFVDLDNNKYYDEIVRKCVLSMHKGSKLLMHNIIIYPQTKRALLNNKTDKHIYGEILKKYNDELGVFGLGILKKVKNNDT